MMRHVAALSLAFALIASSVLAQTAAPPIRAIRTRAISPAVVIPPPASPQLSNEEQFKAAAQAAAQAQTAADEQSPDAEKQKLAAEQQKQIQLIKKTQFDRRPSHILRTWHTFNQEQIAQAKKKEEEAQKAAAEAEAKAKQEAKDQAKKKAAEAKEVEAAKEVEKEGEAEKQEAEGKEEEKSADARTNEDQPAEEKSDEAKPSEEPKSEEQPAAEEKPTEEPATEEPAAKEGAAEVTPAEVPVVEDGEVFFTAMQGFEPPDVSDELFGHPDVNSAEPGFDDAESEGGDNSQAEAKSEGPKEPDFPTQLKEFQRDVTLGRWDEVRAFLTSLDEPVAKELYNQMLRSLGGTPPQVNASVPPELLQQLLQMQRQQRNQGAMAEFNWISLDDLIAIADACPGQMDREASLLMAGVMNVHLQNGFLLDDLIDRLEEETSADPAEATIDKRETAQVLIAANQAKLAKPFLPSIDQATSDQDYEGLDLLTQLYIALFQTDREQSDLEQAWTAAQTILASNEVDQKVRKEALARAVKLAPQVRSVLGDTWLAESFSGDPNQGMEILSTIGATAAESLANRPQNAEERLQSLELVSTAVSALVEASPELATQWQEKLTLLANVWLREAEVTYQLDTTTSRGPNLRRDAYGNYYYDDLLNRQQSQQQTNRRATPIGVADLLKIKPSDLWLSYISDALRPEMNKSIALLLLKVNEEDEAFPYIESLAHTHPKLAEELVSEFLRVWTTNHDPNTTRNRTNYYMYMYGYERKAESIPLTRSKQQRNLKELATLVRRLQALPLEKIDETLLLRAFTTCHSTAEVYRIEAIEEVFGPIDQLDARTFAELTQRMRTNLLSVWRAPAVQDQAQTRRKQRDIMQEVMRGYDVASQVVANGLRRHPDDWRLVLARAALAQDLNDFQRSISPDSQYTERREGVYDEFRRAAELYSQTVGEIKPNEETTQAFETWFYASMGACDPDRLNAAMPVDRSQLPKIREAILALPGEAAERHMASFANTLFTRMSAVPPELKFRYVECGLEIAGEHERAVEARKIYDYYRDLLTEIKLETVLDGSSDVGHGKPFGVFVNIRHTREIERESGGFGRYLQNQQNAQFSYNYGRPLANYRDKFEESVVQAVIDKFDVLSVTFQSEDINSRSTPQEGWRVTPYAYVMLKARGPEVDTIPSFQIDLDFLDTSGYAVIPITSAEIAVDARSEKSEARPAERIVITQTLDERQADEGKLVLEIEATARGIVPPLDQLVDLKPSQFTVEELDDKGVSVTQFDAEADENVVLSERNWLITLVAKPDLPGPPEQFEFPEPKIAVHEVTYQRYDDADLLSVEPLVALEGTYAQANANLWMWLLSLGGVLVVGGIVAILLSLRQSQPLAVDSRFAVPERLTPLSVLNLLNRIESHNGLDPAGRAELEQHKNRIERYYFDDGNHTEPNLEEIATTWSQRATRNGHRV